jgi:transcriptional regulator with XRE-family HTH domain
MTSALSMGMQISATLRKARAKRGMTQEDVAAKIGVTRSHFCRIENGHTTVDDQQLCAWAAAVKVTLSAQMDTPE